MELSEAKELLNTCSREELRDHAFGDVELFWKKDGHDVAGGYFGGGHADIWLSEPYEGGFTGADARELRECGTLEHVTRNDETGPDNFVEGYTMPGLTLQGVLEEITTPLSVLEVDDRTRTYRHRRDADLAIARAHIGRRVHWAGETVLGTITDVVADDVIGRALYVICWDADAPDWWADRIACSTTTLCLTTEPDQTPPREEG